MTVKEWCLITSPTHDRKDVFLYHQPAGVISGKEILDATMRVRANRGESPIEIRLVEKTAYEQLEILHHTLLAQFAERDQHAKEFCRLYNASLDTIVELKKRLGEDPGDY